MSDFDLRNFLTENKLTSSSKATISEEDKDPRYINPDYKPTKTGPLTKAIRTDVNMFMRKLNNPNGLTEVELIDLLEDLRDIAERYIRATLSE